MEFVRVPCGPHASRQIPSLQSGAAVTCRAASLQSTRPNCTLSDSSSCSYSVPGRLRGVAMSILIDPIVTQTRAMLATKRAANDQGGYCLWEFRDEAWMLKKDCCKEGYV